MKIKPPYLQQYNHEERQNTGKNNENSVVVTLGIDINFMFDLSMLKSIVPGVY